MSFIIAQTVKLYMNAHHEPSKEDEKNMRFVRRKDGGIQQQRVGKIEI